MATNEGFNGGVMMYNDGIIMLKWIETYKQELKLQMKHYVSCHYCNNI